MQADTSPGYLLFIFFAERKEGKEQISNKAHKNQ